MSDSTLFVMPSLGADMDAGTIIEWKVKPGDEVRRGDVVAVVETEKSDLDVEVFHPGRVAELLVPPGVKVPVGTPLARIDPPGAPSPPQAAAPPAPAKAEKAELSRTPEPVRKAAPPSRAPASRPSVSPRARKLLREHGLDAAALGPGPIVGADVERLIAIGAPAPPAVPIGRDRAAQQASSRRDAIARLMSRAAREIPHYYVATRIDLQRSLAWLTERNSVRPVAARVLPAAVLLKAVAWGLTQVPALNGWWGEDRFQASDGVHLGVAVAMRDGGLLTPTIFGANEKSVDEIMAELKELVTRARSARLRPAELTGASVTVTNLGERGVESVFGVIVPPQVALVGLGTITEEPWAAGGMLGVRPVVHATLAADHRATDGLTGARFLMAVGDVLQNPQRWDEEKTA